MLVIINLLSINAAALVTLWIAGYRPQGLFDVSPTRRSTYTYATIFGVGLLLLSVPLVGITLNEFETTQLEASAEGAVAGVISGPAYEEVIEYEVEIVREDDYPIRSVDRVIVTIRGLDPGPDAELTDRIYESMAAELDEPVLVEVQYIVAEERGQRSTEEVIPEPPTG